MISVSGGHFLGGLGREKEGIKGGQIANQTERRELYKLFKGSKSREDGDDEVTTKAKS